MTTDLEGSCPHAKNTLRQEVLARRDAIDPTTRKCRSQHLCENMYRRLEGRFEGQIATNATEDSAAFIPTIALYNAMKSEVDLTALFGALQQRAWRVCFPLMLEKGAFTPNADNFTAPGTQSPVHPSASQFCSMAFFAPPGPRGMYAATGSQGVEAAAGVQGVYAAAGIQEPPTPNNTQEILTHPLRRHRANDLEKAGFIFVDPSAIDVIIVPLVAFDNRNFRLGYGGGNYDNYLPLLRKDALIIGVAFEEQRVEVVPTEAHDLPLPSIMVG